MIEKIISRLEAEINEFMKDVPDGDYLRGNVNFCAIAKEIVQEVAKDSGWIPVERELPKEDERILCFHSHGFIDCGELVNGVWCCDMDEYAIKRDNVIAWMPLPSAPYQKGEQYEHE